MKKFIIDDKTFLILVKAVTSALTEQNSFVQHRNDEIKFFFFSVHTLEKNCQEMLNSNLKESLSLLHLFSSKSIGTDRSKNISGHLTLNAALLIKCLMIKLRNSPQLRKNT